MTEVNRSEGGDVRALLAIPAGRALFAAWVALGCANAAGLFMLGRRNHAVGVLAGHVGALARLEAIEWITGTFVVLIVLLAVTAGKRGLLGVAGSSMGLVAIFVIAVPALASGAPGWLVGLVVAGSVAWVAVLLTYMLDAVGFAAATGVGVSVAAIAGAAHVVLTRSGLGDDTAVAAAIVVAAGGMVDVAVTQASAVAELARRGVDGRVFESALKIGRDHIASNMHTLAMAVFGGMLPTLVAHDRAARTASPQVGGELAGGVSGAPTADAVAEQIIVALIATTALVLVTPITTALAWQLIRRLPSDLLLGHHDL